MVRHSVWLVGLVAGSIGTLLGYLLPANVWAKIVLDPILPVGWALLIVVSALGFFTIVIPYFVAVGGGMITGLALKVNPSLAILGVGITLISSGMFVIAYGYWAIKEYYLYREYESTELAKILLPAPALVLLGLILISFYFIFIGRWML